MKARHSLKPVFFVMLAGIMIFLSNSILTGKDNAGKSGKKKMYISSIKSDDVKKPLLDRIRNGITLSILDNYGSVYQILDDEAVKVMYSQAEKIIASGCDDTSCITQIADGINADEIIYGEVSFTGGKVKLVMKSLVRKNIELDTKSMVNVSFREGQTDWFAAETAKKLVDPKYKIDQSKAPREFNSKIDIKGIHIGGVESFNIEVMKFRTNDDQIQNILGYLKELVQSGDDLFAEREYRDSIGKYNTVIEKIDTKLRAESREKMKIFRKGVADRIETSYAMVYKTGMEKIDAELKSESEADEKFLNEIIEDYTDLNKSMNKEIPAEYYSDNAKKIETAVVERIDSCLVAVCGLHEKAGDMAYNEYSFDRALEEYRKTFSIAGKISGTAKSQIFERCRVKIEVTYKTGRSYLENKVKSYTDLAEYYNVKDETSEAKGKIKDARKLMTGSMINFATKSAVDNYNNIAIVLKMEKITEKTEPEIYARLQEEIRHRREAEEAVKRKRLAEEGKQLIDQMKRKGQFKTGKIEIFGGINFILITGGTYTMGSPETEKDRRDDETKHKVTLSPFWIGRSEVTQKQYEDVMGTNPSIFQGKKFPVENISWYDAVEFCNRLSVKEGLMPYYKIDKSKKDPNNSNRDDELKYTVIILGGNGYRLPTEAEWEYACRAGTKTAFHYSGKLDSSMANFYCNYEYNNRGSVFREKTTTVGSFRPNAYGLYDMHGNVWEWCWDWYGNYSSNNYDPRGADKGKQRVLRGGSWCNVDSALRSAGRSSSSANYRGNVVGFRVVRSIY